MKYGRKTAGNQIKLDERSCHREMKEKFYSQHKLENTQIKIFYRRLDLNCARNQSEIQLIYLVISNTEQNLINHLQ